MNNDKKLQQAEKDLLTIPLPSDKNTIKIVLLYILGGITIYKLTCNLFLAAIVWMIALSFYLDVIKPAAKFIRKHKSNTPKNKL